MKNKNQGSTTITVPKELHRHLSNIAMEQTLKKEKRVYIWQVIQERFK